MGRMHFVRKKRIASWRHASGSLAGHHVVSLRKGRVVRACMYVGGLLVRVGTCRPCQRFTREGVHLCVATLHCTGGLHMHAPTRSGDQQGRGEISVKLANTQPCLSINFFLLHVVLSFLFGGNCM